MSFTPEQTAMLEEKLSSSHVASRKQGGTSLSYIEGYHVIDEANRIFGFDGWSYSISDIKEVAKEAVEIGARKTDGFHVGVVAQVEVSIRSEDFGYLSREDVGFGDQRGTSAVAVYEMAYKEAVTDALKRALRSFGNQFGNALYDKTQKNVTTDKPKAKKPAAKKTNGAKSEPVVEGIDFLGLIDKLVSEEECSQFRKEYREAVSYTHLTLPTKA